MSGADAASSAFNFEAAAAYVRRIHGSRPGYFFKMGDEGLGYYLDSAPPPKKKKKKKGVTFKPTERTVDGAATVRLVGVRGVNQVARRLFFSFLFSFAAADRRSSPRR